MTAPRDTVAFKGKAGVNVFWPWGGPIVNTAVSPAVYETADVVFGPIANGPWSSHVTPAVFDQVLAAGFDHFRIQFNPGPWLQGIRNSDTVYNTALFEQFDSCVDSCIAAGIGVVLDPFLTGYVLDTPGSALVNPSPLGGTGSSGFTNFQAMLNAFVSRYVTRDPSMVAFELFNEPPDPTSFTGDWPDVIQPALYAGVRTIAPNHTVVCTGAQWSAISTLVAIDPSAYDKNVLWTFHPFLPACASLQGYIYNQYKYITGLHYPPVSSEQSAAIASMTAAVNADGTLSPTQKTSMISQLTTELNAYFSTPQTEAWLSAQFDPVDAWCAAHNIPPASIYVGEFGMTRTNGGFPGINVPGYQGGTRLDRIHFYRDMKSAIFAHGFRCAPDHLDTLDYGLTFGVDANIGAFDPLLLGAIRPKRNLLQY
ncbi:MAG TPA: cellulase family glycosylhydrolase [Bradyrhizobium sp.]|nr:cellulase family glycosylhydrolase [Bradyrhizobium sp.]